MGPPSRMVIGFTGTRHGMNALQQEVLLSLLNSYKPTEFHHGMCVGSDHEAHQIIKSSFLNCSVYGHPPVNKKYYSYDKVDYKYPDKDYLDRDHDIVNASTVIIATPHTENMVLRSGTWATVRYAKKMKRKLYVILPSGKVDTYLP